MGQELIEARLRPAGRELEHHVAQIEADVELVASGRLEHGAKNSSTLGALIGAGEKSVLATHGRAAHGAFDVAVVDLEHAVLERSAERRPVIERVGDGFAQEALGRHFARMLVEPGFERIEDRLGNALAA